MLDMQSHAEYEEHQLGTDGGLDKSRDDADANLSSEDKQRANPKRTVGTVVVLLVLLLIGYFWYMRSQTYEETDDAQVDAHIAPISARISGTVTAVYVQDNDRVHTGQPLISLDTRTELVAVEQNRAQLEQALAQLKAQQPNVPITNANNRADISTDEAQLAQVQAAVAVSESDRDESAAKLTEAQAQDARDRAQLQRYRQLYEKKEDSREDYEKYASSAASSDANVAAAEAALVAADRTVEQRKAQAVAQRTKRDQDLANAPRELEIRRADIETQRANADAAQSALAKANLNLSFTKVIAPVNGIVTQRSAEIGSQVAEGSQMLMIVETDDLWVTANFKETQLRGMQPGERVRIHVDALDRDFDGYM